MVQSALEIDCNRPGRSRPVDVMLIHQGLRVREASFAAVGAAGAPVALATTSLCVRAGQSSPEELAVRLELNEPYAARKSVKAVWRECARLVEPGKVDESFLRTRVRVAFALSQLAPRSLFSQMLASIDLDDPPSEDEMPWDTAAREAVEAALANADWDEDARTITLHDPDEPRKSNSVTNREELEDHLRSVASDAFYANCSRDDGEYISECDEDGIVQSALANYEERLESFFAKKRRGHP